MRRRAPDAVAGLAGEVDGLPTEGVRAGSEELDALSSPDLVARLLDGQAAAPVRGGRRRGAVGGRGRRRRAAFRAGGRWSTRGRAPPGGSRCRTPPSCPRPSGSTRRACSPCSRAGPGRRARRSRTPRTTTRPGGRTSRGWRRVGRRGWSGSAASGRTPYVLGALRAAREHGAATVAVVNTTGSPAAALAGTAIELVTGPEVLAGSTRLAAGTAQKIALNTLTTAAMVRTGATYGPWMVGVRVTTRSCGAGRSASSATRPASTSTGPAQRSWRRATTSGRRSSVLLAGLDGDAARARLAATGSVRAAVDGPDAGPGSTPTGEPSG